MRYIKRRLHAQPYGGRLVLIDELARANPLVVSPYLRPADSGSASGTTGGIDPVSGKTFSCTVGNSTTQRPTEHGLPLLFPGNTTEIAQFTSVPYQGTISEWTVLAIVRSASGASGSTAVVVTKNYAGSNVPIHLYPSNAGSAFDGAALYNGGWNKSGVNTAILGDAKWHCIAGRYKGGSDLSYILDGRLDSQNTSSIPASVSGTPNDVYVGRANWQANQWKGDILLCLIVLSALDLSFLRAATASIADCWGMLFKPMPMIRYNVFGAGGGGGGGAAHRWFLAV